MRITRSIHKLTSSRLSVRLAAAGLMTALLLSVLVTGVQLTLEIQQHKKTVALDLERMIASTRLPAANAVFTYDYSLAEQIVESLLLNSYVQNVQLLDEHSAVIAEGQRSLRNNLGHAYLQPLLGDPIRTESIDLPLSDKTPGLTGQLNIQYNYHQPFEDLMQSTWVRLILNVIEVCLLTAVLVYLFNRLVTQPVANLTKQLDDIETSPEQGQRLKLIYAHCGDEIGSLTDTINHQLQQLDTLIQENQLTLNEAEQSYENLNTLVETLPHLINVKTLEGKPLLANQAFLNSYRLTADEYLNSENYDLIFESLSSSTRQLLKDADQEAAESGQAVLLPEISWRLPDGHHLALEMRKLSIQYKGQPAILSVGVDITERKQHQEHIQHLAYHDALTDLPNRHLFLDRLDQALLRTQRSQQFGALIFVDLDNFKAINDTRGHLVGDTVLSDVAERLKEAFREEDTVARLGGDEFVICMTDLGGTESDAYSIAYDRSVKLMDAMKQPFQAQGDQLTISASLGLAFFHDHSLTASELLSHADMAMYQAKESGKNRIILFKKEMAEASERLLELKEDSRNALRRNEFHLVFQPQVDARNRKIIGAEALLRWVHPLRGMVSPGEFIPLLEDGEMMPLVGEKVIELAAAQLAEWRQQGLIKDDFRLSLNVSPQQFRQSDFVSIVRNVLERHKVPAYLIDLEITEGMIIDNIDHTVAAMKELREMGIHFSIDDFGTGYSNLNYLKRLPLDVLKVDQSFVRDIEHDANDTAIVRTIIAMADQLRLSTVAEGVETENQLALLRELGCQVFQGYLYSPPLKNVEFATLLQTQLGESA